MATTYTPDPEIGKPCPDFSLLATNGKTYSRKDIEGGKATLVMFICNHCPYVLAVEERLIELGRTNIPRGVKMVAISANDAENYPEDSFPLMKKKAEEKSYPFPYLYDESQEVAKSFGAVCTPDFFLYDASMKLVYRGRLDDSWKNPAAVKSRELQAAIDAVLNGVEVSKNQRPSLGCNIKWKE